MKALNSEQEKTLKIDLQSIKIRLEETLQQANQSAQPVRLDQQAFGRVSRGDALQQQNMAKASLVQIRERLKQTLRALSRIDSEDYGYCLDCDQPIGFPRLQANPETPRCIKCQSLSEQ